MGFFDNFKKSFVSSYSESAEKYDRIVNETYRNQADKRQERYSELSDLSDGELIQNKKVFFYQTMMQK